MSTEKKVQFITLNGKSAYQYALEGGYTGSEAEFKEKMATELEVAYDYDDLNKKLLAASIKPEVSGTFIHVEDAAELPLLGLNYEGENVTFTTTGKNLFDISKVLTNEEYVINNGDSLTINATAGNAGVSSCSPNTLKDYAPNLIIGETYTFSCKFTGTSSWVIYCGGGLKNGQSFILTEEIYNSTITWYASGSDTSAIISDIMINPGSVATEYEPYTSKTITVASPDELNLNDFVMNSPVTNISNDQNLPMTIQYVADAKTYIDNLAGSLTNAVVSLGGEV